jgi:hypothetical protein
MNAALMLAVALTGQVTTRTCQTHQSYSRLQAVNYRQQYAVGYAAPAYRQAAYGYAASYAAPYLEVKFAPVIYDTYAGLVGGEARARNKREQDLLGRADLAARVAALSGSIDKLTARIGQPAPVMVAPPAPGKPPPDVPGKPEPVVVAPPPLPKTNPGVPDDGSVPPPPTVPGPPAPNPGGTTALKPPSADVMAIFKAQTCMKCHTAPAKAGKGIVLFSEPDKLANIDGGMLLKIDSEVYSGSMPRDHDPMGPEDYSKLRAWINDNKDVTDAYLAACRPVKGAN